MNEIGMVLRNTRESSGVDLEEASEDLNIKSVILEQIEDGNIGAFKDIFVLKDQIKEYAKYLGLDDVEIIDNFNKYMFEYTSKIPTKQMEKVVMEKEKTEAKDRKVVSPYTISKEKNKNKLVFVLYGLGIIVGIILIAFLTNYFFIK